MSGIIIYFKLQKLLRCVWWPDIWSIQENVLCVDNKNVIFSSYWTKCFHIYSLSLFALCVTQFTCLFVDFLFRWYGPVGKWELNTGTYATLEYLSPFIFNSTCSMHLEGFMFGKCVFILVVSCWIVPFIYKSWL